MEESPQPRTRIRTILVFSLLVAILGAVVVFAYFSTFARPLTTVILVRHAEKKIEPSNPDPDLTPAGEARAQELARMFADGGITKIFATQYKRTQQTAKPLSDRTGVPITVLDAQQTNEVIRQILSSRDGTILVAGHNNTVPAIVSELSGENFPVIPESEYDNMFIVTIYRTGKAKVLKIKYGSESTQGQGTGTMVPLPK
jgi:broad specificity phosphatase PhoE